MLDWLQHHPAVKRDRTAVSGHSFGARFALYLAVLDETVAALVYNELGLSWRRRAISLRLPAIRTTSYLPGLLMNWFDYFDMYAAMAPRPVLFSEGMRPPEMHRLRKAWETYQTGDRLKVVQQPKFANRPEPEDDTDAEPPHFETMEQYRDYAYGDARNHFFKSEVAVPWLRSYLMT